MSSTILYLAIVAIWAGVLVPRWLRREPHHETSSGSRRGATVSGPEIADAGVAGDLAFCEAGASGVPANAPQEDHLRPRRRIDAGWQPRSPARARAMAARRSLFCLLVALAVAAATIGAAGLASWWVIVPPAAILAGYIMLLREAVHADAEMRDARGAAADLRARGAAAERRGTRGASAEMSPARGAAATSDSAGHRRVSARPVSDAVSPVSGAAGSPVGVADETATAEVVDITPRVDEVLYDQYADAKRRAVGD